MQKIMFSDKFGLTQAVIDGRKTMTRRIMNIDPKRTIVVQSFDKEGNLRGKISTDYGNFGHLIINSRYKIGEVVAVAQSYKDVISQLPADENNVLSGNFAWAAFGMSREKGYKNKMFVRADLMPYQIKITNIRVERLQDISDDDCLKEGIRIYGNFPVQSKDYIGSIEYIPPFGYDDYKLKIFRNLYTPREAFSELIDRVSGKGTWNANPWVLVYEFELVKYNV